METIAEDGATAASMRKARDLLLLRAAFTAWKPNGVLSTTNLLKVALYISPSLSHRPHCFSLSPTLFLTCKHLICSHVSHASSCDLSWRPDVRLTRLVMTCLCLVSQSNLSSNLNFDLFRVILLFPSEEKGCKSS